MPASTFDTASRPAASPLLERGGADPAGERRNCKGAGGTLRPEELLLEGLRPIDAGRTPVLLHEGPVQMAAVGEASLAGDSLRREIR